MVGKVFSAIFIVAILKIWSYKYLLKNYGQRKPVKDESVIQEEPLQEIIVDGMTITNLSNERIKQN